MRAVILGLMILVAVGNGAWAQSQQSVKELVEGIKRSEKESDRKRLEQQLSERTPQKAEDVETLANELEGPLSPLAQKVLAKTTSRDLVPALMSACEKKSVGLKNLKEEDFAKLTPAERSREIGRRLGLTGLINTLGNLKDPRSVELLKKFLEVEGLQYPASTALSRMGDEAIFKELLQRSKTQRDINLSSIKERNLREIVAEIDDPGTSPSGRGRLMGQIKGSKDPAVNAYLRNLILTHKNGEVRQQAGLALMNSLRLDPNAADEDFMVQWLSAPSQTWEEDLGKGWAVLAVSKNWKASYVPLLIGMLQNNKSWSSRADAARVLGEKKVAEAVPYLEYATKYDSESAVRSASRRALISITGRTYLLVHPEDVKNRMKLLSDYPAERLPGEIYPEEQGDGR